MCQNHGHVSVIDPLYSAYTCLLYRKLLAIILNVSQHLQNSLAGFLQFGVTILSKE